MGFLAITVNEVGVLRVDVLVIDKDEYTKAVDFHRSLLPEIERLDKAIRQKYKRPRGDKIH